MTVSLVVTTYNRPEALALVLDSARQQHRLPDEIIIADDGSSEETKRVLEKKATESQIPILHAWQEDEDFRAAMVRNRAIAMATGDYIVMIDGDMVLHPCFIQDHLDAAEEGAFMQGGRVLLSKAATEKASASQNIRFSFFSVGIENRKNALHSSFLNRVFSKKSYALRRIRTCNFALYRNDILAVNGFDNCFVGWGREDSEFAVRLLNSGMVRKNIKFSAIAYHLYHPENPRQSLLENDRRLQRSMDENMIRCENGIERFL